MTAGSGGMCMTMAMPSMIIRVCERASIGLNMETGVNMQRSMRGISVGSLQMNFA